MHFIGSILVALGAIIILSALSFESFSDEIKRLILNEEYEEDEFLTHSYFLGGCLLLLGIIDLIL